MKKELFGRLPSGGDVHLYTLTNGTLTLSVLDYGCRIQSLLFGGRDVVCGFDTLDGYLADDSYQGAFVGRVANRIANGRFTLNGKTYQLEVNNGKNHLHGVFSSIVWEVKEVARDRIVFTHHSPAAEEGYPGDMDVTVTYSLEGSALVLDYVATATEDTPASMTNHAYFNLNGFENPPATNHTLAVNADRYTVVDEGLIPTGERRDVSGTPYDLRTPTLISSRFTDNFKGYDTNFHLLKNTTLIFGRRELGYAGTLTGDAISLACYTDMPCMQIYTAGFLGKGPDFKGGVKQTPYHAVCLETQYEPNAVNRGEAILPAGEEFHHTTAYVFSVL